MRATLLETYDFFQASIERSEGRPTAAGRADFSASPARSVADKRASLLEAARANDPALLQGLSQSDDANSLQRAVAELPPGAADDAANTRMAKLVQALSVASDLTKK